MKAFLGAVVLSIGLAFVASIVLTDNFQTPAHSAFATESVRLGTPGTNLIGQ